jgi:hypothetical protein
MTSSSVRKPRWSSGVLRLVGVDAKSPLTDAIIERRHRAFAESSPRDQDEPARRTHQAIQICLGQASHFRPIDYR